MYIKIGVLKKDQSKAGLEYFKGYINEIPVLGFFRKNDPTTIDLSVDAKKVAWIASQKGKTVTKKT